MFYNARYIEMSKRTNKNDRMESINRMKYGMYNGYYQWDLAKSWLRMSNDNFYNLYGFNWIPPIWLYEEARKYL